MLRIINAFGCRVNNSVDTCRRWRVLFRELSPRFPSDVSRQLLFRCDFHEDSSQKFPHYHITSLPRCTSATRPRVAAWQIFDEDQAF